LAKHRKTDAQALLDTLASGVPVDHLLTCWSAVALLDAKSPDVTPRDNVLTLAGALASAHPLSRAKDRLQVRRKIELLLGTNHE
jgi:hypothetical protein